MRLRQFSGRKVSRKPHLSVTQRNHTSQWRERWRERGGSWAKHSVDGRLAAPVSSDLLLHLLNSSRLLCFRAEERAEPARSRRRWLRGTARKRSTGKGAAGRKVRWHGVARRRELRIILSRWYLKPFALSILRKMLILR